MTEDCHFKLLSKGLCICLYPFMRPRPSIFSAKYPQSYRGKGEMLIYALFEYLFYIFLILPHFKEVMHVFIHCIKTLLKLDIITMS